MATSTYVPLAHHTISGTTARVTFSGLPSIYRDLVIIFNGQVTPNTAYIDYDINGDTTDANYFYNIAQGNGSTPYAHSGNNNNTGPYVYNGPSVFRLDLLDYSANDKHKVGLWRADNSGGMAQMGTFRWASNNVITSISFYDGSGESWASGGTFSIYGIEA